MDFSVSSLWLGLGVSGLSEKFLIRMETKGVRF